MLILHSTVLRPVHNMLSEPATTGLETVMLRCLIKCGVDSVLLDVQFMVCFCNATSLTKVEVINLQYLEHFNRG